MRVWNMCNTFTLVDVYCTAVLENAEFAEA